MLDSEVLAVYMECVKEDDFRDDTSTLPYMYIAFLLYYKSAYSTCHKTRELCQLQRKSRKASK